MIVIVSVALRVPPTLFNDARFRLTFCPAITAPRSIDDLLAADRYTTGASTFWPATVVSTIQTMSCLSLSSCAAVSGCPQVRPSDSPWLTAPSIRLLICGASATWPFRMLLPVCAISCWRIR